MKVIVDGDRFQEEYIKKSKKDYIINILLGIFFIILGSLTFIKSLGTKILIWMFPSALMALFISKLLKFNKYKKSMRKELQISEIINMIFIFLTSMIFFLYPLDSLKLVLKVFSLMIIFKYIILMFMTHYLNIGGLLIGILLFFLGDILIKISNLFIGLFLILWGIYYIIRRPIS